MPSGASTPSRPARGPGPVPGPQRSSEAGVLTPGPGLGPADPLAPGRGGAAPARRPGMIRGRGGADAGLRRLTVCCGAAVWRAVVDADGRIIEEVWVGVPP